MKKSLLVLGTLLLAAVQANAVEIAVHGHRGSRGTAPENSIPAFEQALEAGVDYLEFDMNVTKDGVIVISHEPGINPEICVDKYGNRIPSLIPFMELTLEQVKEYDCGSIQNPRFYKQRPVPGTRIPTLEEVFEFIQNSKIPAAKTVEFNIETKIFPAYPQISPAPEKFAKKVADIIAKYGMEKRVVVQSFDYRTIKHLKKIAPKIRTSQLTYEELLDWKPALKSIKADIWSPEYNWITKESVKEMQKANIKVVPWTVNDEAGWQKMIDFGVDAIITDYPDALLKYLRAKGLHK